MYNSCFPTPYWSAITHLDVLTKPAFICHFTQVEQLNYSSTMKLSEQEITAPKWINNKNPSRTRMILYWCLLRLLLQVIFIISKINCASQKLKQAYPKHACNSIHNYFQAQSKKSVAHFSIFGPWSACLLLLLLLITVLQVSWDELVISTQPANLPRALLYCNYLCPARSLHKQAW